MMTTTQIAAFLDTIRTQSENARRMRATIYRAHTGRWPTYRAHLMRRATGKVVEVAEYARHEREKPYVVIEWSLHKLRMSTHPCATLAEAKIIAACMFRIDGQDEPLERCGLRPL